MQVLILEDALDIRADEFGLSKEVGSNNNGREMLKSVSRLRGENNSLRKSLKEATVNELHAKDQLQIMINENKKLSGLHKAKLSEVSTSKRSGAERSEQSQLCTGVAGSLCSRARNQALCCFFHTPQRTNLLNPRRFKLASTELLLKKSNNGMLAADMKRTEDEKDALLEYVSESLDTVSKLEGDNAGFKTKISEYMKIEGELVDLQKEYTAVKAENDDLTTKGVGGEEEVSERALMKTRNSR